MEREVTLMENYDEIFDNGTYGSAQSRLSTEEWIEMKKQERAELYERH